MHVRRPQKREYQRHVTRVLGHVLRDVGQRRMLLLRCHRRGSGRAVQRMPTTPATAHQHLSKVRQTVTQRHGVDARVAVEVGLDDLARLGAVEGGEARDDPGAGDGSVEGRDDVVVVTVVVGAIVIVVGSVLVKTLGITFTFRHCVLSSFNLLILQQIVINNAILLLLSKMITTLAHQQRPLKLQFQKVKTLKVRPPRCLRKCR
mmetsp:Transcript_40586/g.84937  ORF Transcript_40586/g.84937 Transcript_40586/m.84937 type:complete len:204 (-) Transcript_40586:216-827(-)